MTRRSFFSSVFTPLLIKAKPEIPPGALTQHVVLMNEQEGAEYIGRILYKAVRYDGLIVSGGSNGAQEA